jgi:hypothetical protein
MGRPGRRRTPAGPPRRQDPLRLPDRRVAGCPSGRPLRPQTQAVLAPIRVDAKTNEHQAALELLDILPQRAEGHLISGEAICCQRDLCEKVIERGDDDLLAVKDNQPSLVANLNAGRSSAEHARTFPPTGRIAASEVPLRPRFFARIVERSRGRVEIRTLDTTSIRTCFGTWEGRKQGFRLTRQITRDGKTTEDVVHGITRRSEERANASRLLELVRQHWGVEKRQPDCWRSDNLCVRVGTAYH